MSLFRIQDKTPEVYTSTSRDFQLIGRLYDCIINGVKFDIDSILDIINTDFIDSKLLKLLQTKLGFFSDKYITDDDLRYILKAFPFIVKNKGSLKGIEQAVSLFLKINGVKSQVRIEKNNNTLSNPYTIQISLTTDVKDTTILDEVLRYILPTGYNIEYRFLHDIGDIDLILESKIGTNIVVIKDSLSSLVRGSYIEYKNSIEDYLIGSVGETQVSSPYDINYVGFLDNKDLLPRYRDYPDFNNNVDSFIGSTYIIKNNNVIEYWVFSNSNSVGSEHGWEKIIYDEQNERPYRVYNSSFYGYYVDSKFYENKSNVFTQLPGNPTHSDDLRINGNDPSSCTVVANYTRDDEFDTYSPRHLFDYDYEDIWVSNESTWIKHNMSTYGVEIVGQDLNNEVYIVPKNDIFVYRKEDTVHNVKEAIWTASLNIDNKFAWNTIITDEDKIEEFFKDKPTDISKEEYADVTITGTPLSAIITFTKDNYVYSNEKSWYIKNNKWVEIKRFKISGNPNLSTYIYPIYIGADAIIVGNETISWQSEMNVVSNEISVETDILYIDKDTSNGYRWTGQEFEEVMHFVKAEKVYQISEDELSYLIENGMIKPAFKNFTTIFNDKYSNIFLL